MKKKFTLDGKSEDFLMIPLGGCGHLGKNMMLYYYKKTWIMIDCGASFAQENIDPGIDIIIPDISFIVENKIKISAIVLTHVHEDHVGALHHYFEYLNTKVYCTPLAKEFIKLRFKDRGVIFDEKKFHLIDTDKIQIGEFNIDVIGITHSIPEMKGMLIKAGELKIFHTGDWKFDDSPVVGEKSEIDKMHTLCKDGITALICDSTNVQSSGRSGSEGELEHNLYHLIKQRKGMIFVGTFASNIARMHSICNAAKRAGRTVALSGLSLNKFHAIGRKCGYLQNADIVDIKDALSLPREQVLIICTGCQGEDNATISKIANERHQLIKIHSNDTVIMSSKIIPGNEKRIGLVLNRLAEKNIEVITEKDEKVHVSGHPSQDELRELYEICKPKFAIPVHGESTHLRHHCNFINHNKLAQKSFFIQDGDVILISNDVIKKVGKVKSNYLCVDTNGLIQTTSEVMEARRKMKTSGSFGISLIIKNKHLNSFEYSTSGVSENIDIEKDIIRIIKSADSRIKSIGKNQNIKDDMSIFIKNSIEKLCMKKFDKVPEIHIMIHVL